MAASVKAIIVAALVCGAGAERVRRARERGVRSIEAAAAVAGADGATAAGAYGATAAAATAAAAQQQLAPLQMLQLRLGEEHANFGSNNVIESAGDGVGARADAIVSHVVDNGPLGESLSGEGAKPTPTPEHKKVCDFMWCEFSLAVRHLLSLPARACASRKAHLARAPRPFLSHCSAQAGRSAPTKNGLLFRTTTGAVRHGVSWMCLAM